MNKNFINRSFSMSRGYLKVKTLDFHLIHCKNMILMVC